MGYIGMICFALSFLMTYLIVSFREKNRCLSYCYATIYFLFILFAITEVLSFFHMLDSTYVAVSWWLDTSILMSAALFVHGNKST